MACKRPGKELGLIESVGPLRYRLRGDIAVCDWADVFGIRPAELRVSTLAGLVTTLLGKSPQPGDDAVLNNVRFTVERTRRNKIETIILSLEPLICSGRQPGLPIAAR